MIKEWGSLIDGGSNTQFKNNTPLGVTPRGNLTTPSPTKPWDNPSNTANKPDSIASELSLISSLVGFNNPTIPCSSEC